MAGRATAPAVDPNLLARLSSQMSRGELVLFTGAGFSLSAPAQSGGTVASVSDLRSSLWEIIFPGEPVDASSSLADIFEVAVAQARGRTKEVVTDALRVGGDIPDVYKRWFAQPWYRIYTLNVDDLDEVVNRRTSLPTPIRSLSAVSEGIPVGPDELLSIHLNGTLDDFPDFTFSQRQYGERLARPDVWYQQLVRDLMSRPVVFVGTGLDEPPLWQHLEFRGKRGSGRERRPGSYLVSPSLPAARREMLKAFNVDWIPMTQEEFMVQVLDPLDEARHQGQQAAARRRAPARSRDAVLDVAELRNQPSEDLRGFLMGREPEWGDLGAGGHAIHREFEDALDQQVADQSPRVLVFTGTASSGKSTAIMRLGLSLHAAGKDVRWLDLRRYVPLSRIREELMRESPDVVLVDDVDVLGGSAGRFLAELATENAASLVAVAVRSSRYQLLRLDEALETVPHLEWTIPPLEDSDIDLLLDALSKAGRLGKLRGLPRDEQVAAFRHKAGRQLLVAMLEATSGQKFEEKIFSEYADLEGEASKLYATVALATHLRHGLERQEILLAVGDVTNETANALQELVDRRLLIQRNGLIQTRHRVIAEKVFDFLRGEGHLGETVKGLVFAMATAMAPDSRRTRQGALLVRLINHEWLIRALYNDWAAVRAVYDEVEQILSWDYHYWLQRGSFEVEEGDLRAAENYLDSAKSMAPDDYRVQTEWAYMVLKRAVLNARDPGAEAHAEEAFGELEDAIARRGDSDPYPFHIMGTQGLEWVQAAPISRDDKLGLLARLRLVVQDGKRRHPSDAHIAQLSGQIERLYLTVGAVDGS